MRTKLLLIIAVVLMVPQWGKGNTIAAASCSQADVQTALSAATSATTAITIPAGTCTWTTNLAWSVPSGNANLEIAGATTCTSAYPSSGTCTNRTIIIDNDTSGAGCGRRHAAFEGPKSECPRHADVHRTKTGAATIIA